MATLFDQESPADAEQRSGVHLAVGTVTNNVDLLVQGRVVVRVPALDQEVWARIAAPGAGSGAGFFYVPRNGDELLLGFAGGDPTDAFVIGGLWNTRDRTPVTDPVTALVKRVIRSGVSGGTGHEIEMDDLRQSVTITTATKQKITMDPTKIEISNLAGTVTIKLDNATQSVSITAAASITFEAPQISLKGATVEINGAASTTVKSAGICNVTAPLVKIN